MAKNYTLRKPGKKNEEWFLEIGSQLTLDDVPTIKKDLEKLNSSEFKMKIVFKETSQIDLSGVQLIESLKKEAGTDSGTLIVEGTILDPAKKLLSNCGINII